MTHRTWLRSGSARPQAVIAGLGTPSFVIIAVALTLTIAVLAGEVESRRSDATSTAGRSTALAAVASTACSDAPRPPPRDARCAD